MVKKIREYVGNRVEMKIGGERREREKRER